MTPGIPNLELQLQVLDVACEFNFLLVPELLQASFYAMYRYSLLVPSMLVWIMQVVHLSARQLFPGMINMHHGYAGRYDVFRMNWKVSLIRSRFARFVDIYACGLCCFG